MKQVPILTRGGLTGAIFVVTRYKDTGNGNIEAIEKFDVTEQFQRIVEAINDES